MQIPDFMFAISLSAMFKFSFSSSRSIKQEKEEDCSKFFGVNVSYLKFTQMMYMF